MSSAGHTARAFCQGRSSLMVSLLARTTLCPGRTRAGESSNLSAKSYSPSLCGFSLGPHTLDSCSGTLHTARHCWCLCGKGGKTCDIFTMYYLYSYYNLKTNKIKDERTPSHWPINKVQRLRVTKEKTKNKKTLLIIPSTKYFIS